MFGTREHTLYSLRVQHGFVLSVFEGLRETIIDFEIKEDVWLGYALPQMVIICGDVLEDDWVIPCTTWPRVCLVQNFE